MLDGAVLVAGRGKADPRHQLDHGEDGVASVYCDYCFMGEKVEDDKLSDKCLPILVHKFTQDRWVTSHVVPRKGADSWAVKVSAADIQLSGLQHFIYRSDGGPAIKVLKEAVIRQL